MTEEEFAATASRKQLESFVNNGCTGYDIMPTHYHKWEPANAQDLTTAQLRKLALYRSGAAERCVCGFVRLADFMPPLVYSRNGNKVTE